MNSHAASPPRHPSSSSSSSSSATAGVTLVLLASCLAYFAWQPRMGLHEGVPPAASADLSSAAVVESSGGGIDEFSFVGRNGKQADAAAAGSTFFAPTTRLPPPYVIHHDQLMLDLLEAPPTFRERIFWHVQKVRPVHSSAAVVAAVPLSNFELAFEPQPAGVALDIGTNANPDSITEFWANKSIALMWFEPQRWHLHKALSSPIVELSRQAGERRVAAFPAAVAEYDGYINISITANQGCSSVLQPNNGNAQNASPNRRRGTGGDATAGSSGSGGNDSAVVVPAATLPPARGNRNQRRWDRMLHASCTASRGRFLVPCVRGATIAALIPTHLPIISLSIDGQGFDLNILASFGTHARRARVIILECQDVPEGSPLFMTEGSFSCADAKHCIEANLPHRMVSPTTGRPTDGCPYNNKYTRENNCVFALPNYPVMPWGPLPVLRRKLHKLEHPPRASLVCPFKNFELE